MLSLRQNIPKIFDACNAITVKIQQRFKRVYVGKALRSFRRDFVNKILNRNSNLIIAGDVIAYLIGACVLIAGSVWLIANARKKWRESKTAEEKAADKAKQEQGNDPRQKLNNNINSLAEKSKDIENSMKQDITSELKKLEPKQIKTAERQNTEGQKMHMNGVRQNDIAKPQPSNMQSSNSNILGFHTSMNQRTNHNVPSQQPIMPFLSTNDTSSKLSQRNKGAGTLHDKRIMPTLNSNSSSMSSQMSQSINNNNRHNDSLKLHDPININNVDSSMERQQKGIFGQPVNTKVNKQISMDDVHKAELNQGINGLYG